MVKKVLDRRILNQFAQFDVNRSKYFKSKYYQLSLKNLIGILSNG